MTFSYLNLVFALVATMFLAGTSPVCAVLSAVWLAFAAFQAQKEGLLDDDE